MNLVHMLSRIRHKILIWLGLFFHHQYDEENLNSRNLSSMVWRKLTYEQISLMSKTDQRVSEIVVK